MATRLKAMPKLFRTLLLATLAASSLPAQPSSQNSLGAPVVAAAAKPAIKVEAPGLPNLGRVTVNLYRGGQPEKEGYAELKKLGIEVVVNFRETDQAHKDERSNLEALGMKYVEIPWRGFDNPDNKQVAQFLQLLRDSSGKKVFFHCRRGAERTGVMGAAYRIAFERWTPEQALTEMEQFKFRGFWFRHLKKYVRSFPEQLESDPSLQPFRPK